MILHICCSITSLYIIHFQVWPAGKVVFPDYFHPDTAQYWIDMIKEHINEIDFDGLWIVSRKILSQIIYVGRSGRR